MVRASVDAFAVVAGLEHEMAAWLGPVEAESVDRGYDMWETDGWTFAAEVVSETRLELVIESR